MSSFRELGLSETLVSSLERIGYASATPIQEKAIPLLLQGRDLMGLAQTGTGKTAAFGLPVIEMLAKLGSKPQNRTTRCLVLAPTRELVNQIGENLRAYVRGMHLKVNQVVGGASINKQQLQLEKGTDILVATPGRLLDLISRNAINLSDVRYLVLDEADQMLDLGFIHDLRKISKMVPAKRQTLLFSATMPRLIEDLADSFLKNPIRVEVTPPGKAADKVEQFVHFVTGKNDKTELLKETLNKNPEGRSIVFLRTKHGAEKLSKYLAHVGYKVASIHGNKTQGQRERALKSFKDGEINVLVATDVAARGIDIPAVTHVYNYDLPEVADAYVHRIGRTARAGLDGIAIAFCAPDETRLLRDIERLMNIELKVLSGERPTVLASPKRGSGARGNAGAGAGAGRRQGGERSGGPSEGGDRPKRERRDRKPREARAPRVPALDDLVVLERDNDLDTSSDFKRLKIADGVAQKPAGGRKFRGGQGRPPQRKSGGAAGAGAGAAAGRRRKRG